jgi:hypothetical protein
VNVGSLRTRADYRSALETINPSADNMGTVAAMLRNAGLAGEVFDYLGTLETAPGARGKTLFQLSQDAPAVTVLDSLTTAQDDLKTAVTDGNVAVKDAVSAMHLDVAAILGAIAASSASTARQLTTWDDGGALTTTSAV